jgi:ankyrin repeat protein
MLIDDRTYHAILDALGKGFVDFESTIKGPNKGPKASKPSWVIGTDDFKVWRNESTCPLLWIHGKTGTLEDSIASSAIECLHTTKEQGDITVSFFCDQSDEIRRSLRGMLMLLIRQLIEFDQDLAVELLTDAKRGKNAGKQVFDPESLSKASALWDALHSMARKLGSGRIRVVVFGLEQLSQESIKEFADYMNDMLTTISSTNQEILPIKWMLLSRSGRPDIEKALKGKSSEINLDDSCNSGYVSDALRGDISARVDELNLSKPLAYFIKRHIHSRADGNFIYVSLVIQELKNAQETEKATHAEIRALLESFPYGLTDMYEHVRKRVLKPGAEGLDYTKEILRCMIASERAPTLRELALIADLPEEDQDDLEAIKTHIIRCGAFLTVTGSWFGEDSNTVEWIDMSAPEHLQKYAKDDLALDPKLMKIQHGIIALRCLEHLYGVIDYAQGRELAREEKLKAEADANAKLEAEKLEVENPDEELPFAHVGEDKEDKGDREDEEEDEDNDSPDKAKDKSSDAAESDEDKPEYDWIELDDENMQYPIQYWIEHAKRADVDVIEEFQTTHSFWNEDSKSRQKWWEKNEIMHELPGQTDISVLHVATIAKFPALIDHLLKGDWESEVHKEDSLGNQPLFYACSGGEYEIVETLLGAKADINFVSSDERVTALYGAASNGHMDIVEMLLDRGADIDANSSTYGTPLYIATENGRIKVMELLIRRKAKVNLIGGSARRPLNIAAFNGDVEAVGILIDHGADVDPDEEYWYGSALGAAARRGHTDVVKLLLSKGWSPSRNMKTYGSFLTAAATYGHIEIVEALVQKEARITVLEQALQAASQNGKTTVVKLILDRTPAPRHQKAFMLAAFYGRDEVLKLLYARGMPQDKLDAALYEAADHEHEQTVKLLLEFGANPDAEGKE